MKLKRTLTLATLMTLGAAAYMPLPSMAQDVSFYIGSAPPAPRFESVPYERHGYVWAPGYWNWEGRRHVWIPGRYMVERPGYVYAQPTWYERGGRWYMEPSRWTPRDQYRGRDRDRDGIPDRYEQRGDRDRDGIPDRYEQRGDRDRDGIPDRFEHGRDRDRDGVPDRLERRGGHDLDGDGVPNHRDRDRDGDGVRNDRDYRPDNPRRY